MIEQVRAPVRWVETIEYLAGMGDVRFLECGPGKVLTGLMRRITRALPAASLATPEAMQQALTA